MISVVTVTKNDEERLLTTISSLSQYYKLKNFQHIIINGGIISNSKQKKIRLNKNIILINESDSGIYDAMNKGIGICSSSYILFLNCGDQLIMAPKVLNETLKHSNKFNIICFPFIHEWFYGSIIKYPLHLKEYCLPTSHQAILFGKNFIQKNMYDTRYKIAADFDLFQKSNFNEIHLEKNCKPFVIVEGNGFASSNGAKSYFEYFLIINRKYGFFLGAKSLFIISIKAFFSIITKTILPERWLVRLRLKISRLSEFYYGK